MAISYTSFRREFLGAFTHAAMEPLGAFVTKTLARLHSAPAVTILVGVIATTEVFSAITVFAIAFGGISIAIPAKLGESVGFVVFKGLASPE